MTHNATTATNPSAQPTTTVDPSLYANAPWNKSTATNTQATYPYNYNYAAYGTNPYYYSGYNYPTTGPTSTVTSGVAATTTHSTIAR